MLSKSSLIGAAAAAVMALVLVPAAGAGAASCRQVEAPDEPPCNPALPDSPWGASHRNSYAQASSPYPGLRSADVRPQHLALPGIPIQIQFTQPYRDGGRVAWASLVSSVDNRPLVKVDVNSGRLIDTYRTDQRETDPPMSGGGLTGAYNVLDRDGNFIVPRGTAIDVFGDERPSDRLSPIALRRRFVLPPSALCRDDDRIAGATMTYSGRLAFVTAQGMVGVVPRQPGRMTENNLRILSLNGSRCAASGVATESLEQVSNSIAADEDGGIYVVTSKRMHRVDFDARTRRLTRTWAVPYNAGSGTSEIRLGEGSGSTPTVMGTGDQDKLVVITDGQDVMHEDLFWRDEVPKDFRGLRNRPRRMACEHPVTFGDPRIRAAVSEQSVTVRGYATLNVQNILDFTFDPAATGTVRTALAGLRGGDPAAAPHGAQRIDWDPERRRCHSVWANRRVSVPNGIPAMSARSGLAYTIAQRRGFWGVEALDWDTGRSKFFAPASATGCGQEALDLLAQAPVNTLLRPVLDELPQSCENSFYAATEVGPGGAIWTGTFLGLTIYRPG